MILGAAFACLLVSGISAMVLYWEVNSILTWTSDPSHLLEQVWTLAMISTVTLAWFTLLPFLSALASRRPRLAMGFGLFILFLGGPNLFAWDVFGVVVGALKFRDFCLNREHCNNDSFVIAMQVCSWIVLYCISGLCSYALYFLLKRKWRRGSRKRLHGEIHRGLTEETICGLCRTVCSEGTQLSCQHYFHSDCLRGSLVCPLCTHEDAVELSSA